MNKETRAKISQWIKNKQVQVVEVSTPRQPSQPIEVVEKPTIVAEQRPVLREEVILGNNVDVLKQFPDNTFTAVVTDPPYGLSAQPDMREVLKHWLAGDDYEHTSNGFMGKSWDSFVPGPKTWEQIMRVLKPGGHIFSFSGTRTYDLMVTAMRLAGSEIRDKIDYYCGPENYMAWCHGQGFPKSLNIGKAFEKTSPNDAKLWEGYGTALKPAHEPIAIFGKGDSQFSPESPFKYEAKASGKERNAGCEDLFWLVDTNGRTYTIPKEDYDRMAVENEARKDEEGFEKHKISQGNIWPTVKPLDLMRYLVKMVKMPGDNLILDPFMGSGTTMVACVLEGCGYVGIDMDDVAVRIAKHRIDYAKKNGENGYK